MKGDDKTVQNSSKDKYHSMGDEKNLKFKFLFRFRCDFQSQHELMNRRPSWDIQDSQVLVGIVRSNQNNVFTRGRRIQISNENDDHSSTSEQQS